MVIQDILAKHSRIMIDTAPIIYFIEEHESYAGITEELFKELTQNEEYFLFSSMITLIEVLTYPLKQNNDTIAEKYRDFLLNSANFTLYQIDALISEKAAELRAQYNIKTPDAIQLAVAYENNGTLFITNDTALKKIDNIDVLVLKDLL